MTATGASSTSLDTELEDERARLAIVGLLTRAYWMEIETVTQYIAASIRQDGSRGLAVRTALQEGVEEEVAHARALGRRIQELHGLAPGAGLDGADEHPQAFARPVDVDALVEAVVATETSAVRHYMRIMRATAQIDEDTNALALEILRDEQRHLRLFQGYLGVESAKADSID